MSELDRRHSPPCFHPKVDLFSNFGEEPSEADNIRSNKVSPCRGSAPVLIIGPSDSPFVGLIKHEAMNQNQKKLDEALPFLECTTVGSCRSAHTYQSMDDGFVSVSCHDTTRKQQNSTSFSLTIRKHGLAMCQSEFISQCFSGYVSKYIFQFIPSSEPKVPRSVHHRVRPIVQVPVCQRVRPKCKSKCMTKFGTQLQP